MNFRYVTFNMELQRKRKVGKYSDKVRYMNKVRTYRGAMYTGNKG